MVSHDFFRFDPGDAERLATGGSARRPEAGTQDGAWRILPLEGSLEIVYEDVRGAWSTRVLDARELKLGPGRTLLGGTDRRNGLYRGLRADRIRRLTDPATGLRIETGILDWLLARAEAQRRERAARERARARTSSPSRRVGAAA